MKRSKRIPGNVITITWIIRLNTVTTLSSSRGKREFTLRQTVMDWPSLTRSLLAHAKRHAHKCIALAAFLERTGYGFMLNFTNKDRDDLTVIGTSGGLCVYWLSDMLLFFVTCLCVKYEMKDHMSQIKLIKTMLSIVDIQYNSLQIYYNTNIRHIQKCICISIKTEIWKL